MRAVAGCISAWAVSPPTLVSTTSWAGVSHAHTTMGCPISRRSTPMGCPWTLRPYRRFCAKLAMSVGTSANGISAGSPRATRSPQIRDLTLASANETAAVSITTIQDLWRSNESDKNSFFGSWSRMKPDRLSDFATAGAEDRYQLDEGGRPFDKPLDLALGFLKKYNDRPFLPQLLHLLRAWPHSDARPRSLRPLPEQDGPGLPR